MTPQPSAATSPPPSRAPFPAGAVTQSTSDAGTVISSTLLTARAPAKRRSMLWWGGGAAAVLVLGLVAVLVLINTGELGSGQGFFAANDSPPDLRPPLARLCPPPSAFADPAPAPAAPPPSAIADGPRTVDPAAGISYRAYGAPWTPWPYLWTAGTLGVPYGVGQHFITEFEANGEAYHASILSAAVPATVNDGMVIDIECTGRQVAADARAEYYPQPNTMELIRDGVATLAGFAAWVTTFRLHFSEPGLVAKDELIGIAVIDVGRPTAAVLYISIPGTNHEWDHAVDEVLASVQPA